MTPERKSPPPSKVKLSIQDRTRSCYRISDGKACVSGTTHWAKIACEFEEACPYIFGTDPEWEPRYRQIKSLKYLFSSFTAVNFPFSSISALAPTQRDIIDSLPPRHIVEALVKCYFQSCEITHRLFHPLQFWDEMHAFWSNPNQVLDGWLAQLCMILALGCQTAPEYLFQNTARSASEWTDVFLEGAQLCFGRSPFMSMPNLTTIRTLCLMVMAKMLELIKGSTPSEVVFLMGFVTRLAMTLQLHRATKLFPAMPAFEAEMRKRLWTTIQLLDIDVAMRSGTSFVCREQDTEAPLNVNETDFRRSAHGDWTVATLWASPHDYTDGMFQVKLAEILPLLAEIIDTVNSPTQSLIEYEKVMMWDSKIRKQLKDMESVFSLGLRSRPDRNRTAATQRQFLEVLAHRSLLAMHHAYARVPHDTRFELSYKTVRESSLALLGTQESWVRSSYPDSLSSDSRSSSPSSISTEESPSFNGWLVDLCHDDFLTAMLYMILTIRRDDFGGNKHDDKPPRDMAWVVLRRGLTLARQRACRSLSHFKEFAGLSFLIGCLQCLGMAESMLPTMMQIADQVEQIILTGKQELMWMENNSNLLLQTSPYVGSMMDMDPGLLTQFMYEKL